MPPALCVYRNTVFVCDTGNKAVRMLTSAKGLIPLQSVMAGYANIYANSFFKGMRADHDMPTVIGYAYRRGRCVEDDMLRIYQKHFSYFIGPNSYYPEKSLKVIPRTSRHEQTSR